MKEVNDKLKAKAKKRKEKAFERSIKETGESELNNAYLSN